jgi:hypothetical protein
MSSISLQQPARSVDDLHHPVGTGSLQDRTNAAAQRTVASPHSLCYTATYAGMSRTTSVNLPELIS